MQEELKNASGRVVGIKQLLRGLEADEVACVYLAEDAETHVQEKVKAAAQKEMVRVVLVGSMAELGETCGIDVGAACAGVLKG